MKGIYLGACRAYHPNSKKTYREGGLNVFNVIEYWLKIVNS